MPFEQEQHPDRHPVFRWIGHALGIVYILVTLLFGPIKALAHWLAQQRLIQRYGHWMAGFTPTAGLAASLLSLSLLELSKIAVLLSIVDPENWDHDARESGYRDYENLPKIGIRSD